MGRRTTYSAGTPCWVDLSTTDLEAAARFYGAVLGWKVREQPSGAYSFFERDGDVVAGLAQLSPEQAAAGMPPAWSMYVKADDPDALAARVIELGGTVRTAAFDVPEAGRMAVVADPQGAIFLLWKPAPFEGAEVVNGVGAWAWNDVQTPDPAAAADFYRALLGWEIAEVPGSGGQYWSIIHEGRAIGGVMAAPPGVDRPFWASYFGVDSVAAALEHAEAAGGKRLAGPIDVPTGRFAAVTDATGAVFSVLEGTYDD
jgi:predicted enzyme related to lactoylglutathione lyase